MAFRAWSGLLFLVIVGSCAGAEDPMTEDEFCREYAKRECAEVAPLCSFTPAACEPGRLEACRAFAATWKSANRQYVPSNTGRCLDKVSAVYRSNGAVIAPRELADLEATCARVYQGMAQENETCTIDQDCANDLICDKGRCGTRKQVASKAGCANIGEHCPVDEHCSNKTGVYFCVARQDKDAVCSDTEPCRAAYRCVGTCKPKLDLGQVCASHGDCQSDYCNPYGGICGTGLNFALGSLSCQAYMGDSNADAGVADGPIESASDASGDDAAVDSSDIQ